MSQEQEFIQDWDAKNIDFPNVVEVYVSDDDGGHVVPLLIVSVDVEGNINEYEAIDIEIGSEIAGSGSIHTLGKSIFNRYIKFDGYTVLQMSEVYEDIDEWKDSFKQVQK
uniref:hypothetical protein n=1 Tax=Lactobacillus acidophilus TaxID=1579 RepID=UPI003F549991